MPSSTWMSLDTPYAALQFLDTAMRGLTNTPGLGVISIDWSGCLACGGEGSPYIALRDSLPHRYINRSFPIHYGICNWRKSTIQNFSEPVHRSYRLLMYMLRTHSQRYGGGRRFETFTNLDESVYWRPKFPHLLFIDGASIDPASMTALWDILDSGPLCHPYYEDLGHNQFCENIEIHGGLLDLAEVDDEDRQTVSMMRRVMSGDVELTTQDTRDALHRLLADAVLLQLTNYNLYRADGDRPEDFMTAETLQSCDCVVTQYENNRSTPTDCFYFDRRP